MIETERLILRPLTPADADALAVVLSDPVAMRFYPAPFDRAGVETWIRRWMEHEERHGYSLWAMVLKSTGECIGDCGISVQTIDGALEDEIGYHLQARHGKRGYATEAARACRDHVFRRLGRTRVVSWMTPAHADSRRVAERIGMTLEKETRHPTKGMPLVVYSMSRLQWEERACT